eukprot:GHVP01054203.1.p1 GENE.GHVP01054203.1~~GHVP01054203.1.p1  ORF type:complete len:293 (-),score=70.19 GHVP01054203.1:42-920(-)
MATICIKYGTSQTNVDVCLKTTTLEMLLDILSKNKTFKLISFQLVFRGRILSDPLMILEQYGMEDGASVYLASINPEENQKTLLTIADVEKDKKEETKRQEKSTGPLISFMKMNPDMLRQMILANKEFADLIKKRPEMSAILDDPAYMEQILDSMKSPNANKEAMRTHDLALKNIESMPNGFDALRNLYESMQNQSEESLEQKSPKNTRKNLKMDPRIPNPWKKTDSLDMGCLKERIDSMEEGSHEARYNIEIQKLCSMGFNNKEQNLKLLIEKDGDLAAVLATLVRLKHSK